MIKFISGWVIGISLYAIYTDILGLEGYIAKLRAPNGWIDPKISIPFYIILIIFCIIGLYKDHTKEENGYVVSTVVKGRSKAVAILKSEKFGLHVIEAYKQRFPEYKYELDKVEIFRGVKIGDKKEEEDVK